MVNYTDFYSLIFGGIYTKILKMTTQQEQSQGDRMTAEESNLMITGPPASRTVIDNLKKLLVQRQHSRESDTEVWMQNQ